MVQAAQHVHGPLPGEEVVTVQYTQELGTLEASCFQKGWPFHELFHELYQRNRPEAC